jgi:hypothetical protein
VDVHPGNEGKAIDVIRLLPVAVALTLAPGCLVLSVNPVYDDETIAWDATLVGSWQDPEDKASMEIDRGEWKSYRVKYVHPIESGTVTGYLTVIGDERFLDVMPSRGEDRGSFLVPVHAVLRVRLEGDRLELTPLSWDWMNERLRVGTRIPGLDVVFDQKENALVVSPSTALRMWLRKQPKNGPMFGAAAVFTRSAGTSREH